MARDTGVDVGHLKSCAVAAETLVISSRISFSNCLILDSNSTISLPSLSFVRSTSTVLMKFSSALANATSWSVSCKNYVVSSAFSTKSSSLVDSVVEGGQLVVCALAVFVQKIKRSTIKRSFFIPLVNGRLKRRIGAAWLGCSCTMSVANCLPTA